MAMRSTSGASGQYPCGLCGRLVGRRAYTLDERPGRYFCCMGCAVGFQRGDPPPDPADLPDIRYNPERTSRIRRSGAAYEPATSRAFGIVAPVSSRLRADADGLHEALRKHNGLSSYSGSPVYEDDAVLVVARPDPRQMSLPGIPGPAQAALAAVVSGDEWDEHGDDLVERVQSDQYPFVEFFDARKE